MDVASESEENAPAKPSAVAIHAHSTHVSHTTAGEWEQPPLTFAISGGENRAQQLQNANDEERGADPVGSIGRLRVVESARIRAAGLGHGGTNAEGKRITK